MTTSLDPGILAWRSSATFSGERGSESPYRSRVGTPMRGSTSLRAQLKSGRIREVHAFAEGDAGYFITGDVTDEQVFEDLSVWSPYVTFELHRTIPFPKASEIVLKALKARAGRA